MKYQSFYRPWRCLVVTAWCLILSACVSEETPPLRVAFNQWPGYGSLLLARERGWLDERRIRLVEMPSAVEVIHGIRNGTIEAGLLTLDETLSLVSEGVDLRVLLVMDISFGGDALLARPGLGALADLKGKTVGVEASATGAILLESALDKAGIGTAEVRIKSLGVKEQMSAYTQGDVDAVVCFEPNKSKLLAQGAQVLFDSRQIPGRILDVLVVRAELLEKHAPALHELAAAHFSGISELLTKPQETAALISPHLGMSPNGLLTALRGLQLPQLDDNQRLLGRPSVGIHALASQLSQYMILKGLMAEEIDLAHLFDDRFLSRIHIGSAASVVSDAAAQLACDVPTGSSRSDCSGSR